MYPYTYGRLVTTNTNIVTTITKRRSSALTKAPLIVNCLDFWRTEVISPTLRPPAISYPVSYPFLAENLHKARLLRFHLLPDTCLRK